MWKLDVDPQRDDDASPISTYRWDLLECWFQLFHTSQIQIQTFLKKNHIFWFPCCSTREDLSIDVSITNVGLILTKIGRFLFSAYGNSGYGQKSISSISNFLKKIHIFGFPWCSTREDPSIDVSITNVRLTLTKLGWFLFSGYGQTGFWNPHMETCRHTKNFNSKLKISGYPSIPICLPRGRGCIKILQSLDHLIYICNVLIRFL